jgi:glycosyltransferase involved in cell wall biosynthesis
VSAKRIIFTVTNDLVFDQRMQRISTSLVDQGYVVELVGRFLPDSKPVSKQNFLQTRLKCRYNKRWLFYAEFNIRLFFYLLFSKADVICGCDLDTLPAAWLAARLKGIKVVYDAHEYFTESPELIGRKGVQGIWRMIESFLVPRVDGAYTVTESIAVLFQKKYHKSFSVIRNLPYFRQPVKQSAEKYILYQGAVNLGRGVKEMLLVMMHLDMPFYVAGDGDSMEEIKSLVKQYKLEHKVKWLGKLPPAELRSVTDNAYIGVNLLENRGLNYYYSLGNKFFDYIQSQVPQVSIAFPEYIRINDQYHIAEMVDELIIDKIVEAFKKLLNDETRYAELKQNCDLAAKDLCWEKEEQKLIKIYNEISPLERGVRGV